jgi:hypothetical protein
MGVYVRQPLPKPLLQPLPSPLLKPLLNPHVGFMNPGTGYPVQYPAALPVVGPKPEGPVRSPFGMVSSPLFLCLCTIYIY